jgi:hypothetical protein
MLHSTITIIIITYRYHTGLMCFVYSMRIDVSKCRPLFWNTCDRAREELTDTILPQRGC